MRPVEVRDDKESATLPTNVLVLGASGSVGACLAAALVRDGVTVRAVHRQQEAASHLQQVGLEPYAGHLGDPDSLLRAAEGCQVVFHCAGESCMRADPTALSWTHVAGTENVIAAARAAGVSRVVMLSCADVHLQNRDRVHVREDIPQAKASLGAWARTKLLAEEMALQASSAALEVTAIRPGYLWGRGDFTNLPTLCREGVAGGIRLFGSGAGLFSAAHMDNVVHALRLAAAAPKAPGQAIFVSDGEYETAREFFTSMSQALQFPAPRPGIGALSRSLARLGDVLNMGKEDDLGYAAVVRRSRACLLDIQRAINDLNYSPIITRAEALSDLAAFVQEQGGPASLAQRSRQVAGTAEVEAFKRLLVSE